MGSGDGLRALLAVRLSNLTDETTSPERQRAVTTEHVRRQGWAVAGVAEDLDVSASVVPPFERPALGPWLAEPKCHEWDALVFWRADRAVRSMADMFTLTQWAQRMRKVIVFVSGPFGGDPLTLDLRQNRADPHVSLILAIISFAAEVESQAIKERVNATRAFLLPTDRWVGGIPGYVYRLVDHPVKGKTIERDEYAAGVIREIAGWLCDGETVAGIAHKLNERGELTYRDHVRVEQGKPTRSRGRGTHRGIDRELWSVHAIRTIMTSPRLLGYKVHKGKDTGLTNLPLHDLDQNRIWCAIITLACELTAWAQTLTLTDHPARRWEPKRLRLRLFCCRRPGRALADVSRRWSASARLHRLRPLVENIVVLRSLIEPGEHCASRRWHVTDRVVVADESLDRLHVVEPHKRHEFDLITRFATNQIDMVKSWYAARFDARNDLPAYHRFVCLRVVHGRPAVPHPTDHCTNLL
jgi:DNA invertase Pin-like site-specific DNA recombinase